ncbi:MAG: peptidase M64 [Calditrichaeota bacterium]|nr:peptidase M64 [Calditrichota bacterium]
MERMFWIFVALLAGILTGLGAQQNAFSTYFEDQTLRVDYYHVGTADQESIVLDELYRLDGWAGSRINLIDTLNRGHYLLRVFDNRTQQLIFSRGFSTLFNEWQTTEEARQGGQKVIHETVRLPFPRRPILIEIVSRDRKNRFTEVIFSRVIDPDQETIRKEPRISDVLVEHLIENGEPSHHVDVVILGDGFTSDEWDRFREQASWLVDTLFTISPFKEHRSRFNVSLVLKPSPESGTDDPRAGVFKRTPLNTTFNTFRLQRYLMTYDNRAVQDVASAVPFDAIIILVNTRKYGGGGIYNLYASTAAFHPWTPYVFVHEFGHSFAGLGDEYYTSQVAYSEFYPKGTEPWEPNITALLNPPSVKWQRFVAPDTPIPTPWGKEKYDQFNREFGQKLSELRRQGAPESKIKKLSREYRKKIKMFFEKNPYKEAVGAFEGAGYASRGLYRPALDCIMFSRTLAGFDPVCAQAIEQTIRFIAR